MSDGIRRSLQTTQRGRSIDGVSSKANFHIEDIEGVLRLYLPRDEVERDVCFESDLPRRLCTFLGLIDAGSVSVIGGIFRKDNPAVIARILENAGVGQPDCDFAALDKELGLADTSSDTKTLVQTTNSINLFSPNLGQRLHTPSDEERRRVGRSQTDILHDIHAISMPIHSYEERQVQVQDTAYKSILENIVDVARRRAHCGVLELTGVAGRGLVSTKALSPETIRQAFATRSQERDFKIGAAGELYMFEYLKELDLPDFGLKNWKSGIRDRVNKHIDYHNLENSHDRGAISDIEYLDKSGKFTHQLIYKGHLASGWLWATETPLYHIEVKTTTSSDWQEPFYMSKAQERHVRLPFPQTSVLLHDTRFKRSVSKMAKVVRASI